MLGTSKCILVLYLFKPSLLENSVKLLLTLLFISSYSLAGIYEPYTLWDKTEITVCFVDDLEQTGEINNNLLKLTKSEVNLLKGKKASKWNNFIKKRVTDNFTKKNTGISFQGWEGCSISPDADAYIILSRVLARRGSTRLEGLASVGQDGVKSFKEHTYFSKGNSKPYVYLNIFNHKAKVSAASNLGTTVVHEFGHLAGLRHEHSRKEGFFKDQRCVKLWSDTHLKNDTTGRLTYPILRLSGFVESEGRSSIVATDYDRDSIMNYCSFYTEKRGELNNLTQNDMQTLRIMYPY